MKESTLLAIKGSWKNAVSTVCGTVLSNIVDPQTFIFSMKWFKHILTVTVILVTVNELRYWKEWADNTSLKTTIVLSFFTAFFCGLIFQFIFHASKF